MEKNFTEIPFGANDSELKGWEYTIPEGFEAEIKDGKIVVREKESEDERIRKRIRLCLDECVHSDIIRDYERDECLAYLEKQKKQKPAEKQDYSGLTDLERVIHRGFLVAGVENVPVAIIKETAKECLAEMKPAEWSEEDKKRLERIIKLHSVDLEDRRKFIICFGSNDLTERERDIDWLKELPSRFNPQPHWRPSEEQMKALKYVAYHLMPDENYRDEMFSLYNDLKKLM